MPQAGINHCVNCVLYKIYPTTVSTYSSFTTLYQRTTSAEMHVCMSLQHWLCFHTLAKLVTPHMKLHSMLHALSCCQYM